MMASKKPFRSLLEVTALILHLVMAFGMRLHVLLSELASASHQFFFPLWQKIIRIVEDEVQLESSGGCVKCGPVLGVVVLTVIPLVSYLSRHSSGNAMVVSLFLVQGGV